MNLTIEQLASIIADYIQVGYMEAVRAYEPTQDIIKTSEVLRWLRFVHIDRKRFNALVKKGLIRRKRLGPAKNSAFGYSKKEIKQAVAASKISSIIVQEYITKVLCK